MHFARVPPGQLGEGGAGGVGVGGAGGVGVGGVGGVGVGGAGGAGGRGGEGGAGGPGVLVVPMSPNRIFEKVARCGPPVSVVDTWHGPAFTHLKSGTTTAFISVPSFSVAVRGRSISKRMRKTANRCVAHLVHELTPSSQDIPVCVPPCESGPCEAGCPATT
jgi:hypothetical protein